jgi:hypothetical protein
MGFKCFAHDYNHVERAFLRSSQGRLLAMANPVPAALAATPHTEQVKADALAPEAAIILSFLGDKVHLSRSLTELHAEYASAKPFPHVVIDNLFSDAFVQKLPEEIPPITADTFVHHHDEHQAKFGLRSAVHLGETGFQFAALLHSAAFLYMLSEITGIWGLLPDPYLQGGGFHVIPPGGKFDIHLDRKTDYTTGLRRRLAFITYLNHDWRHEYGGQLELWNADGTRCEVMVEPLFNRTIIFEVADGNYHGHPTPVACPGNRTRNSFAVYYHTVGEGVKNIDIRSSQFAPNFYRAPESKVKKLAKDLIPPMVLRSLREARMRRKRS